MMLVLILVFSLFLASLKSFEGRCYAFEPTPNSYENLNAIVNEFDLDGRIEPINAALSNRSGDLLMNLPIETHSGYAKVVSIDDLNTYKVSSKSLDEWVVTEEKIAPTFIKIHVEGHELEVLLGADKTIASHRPYIYFENGNTLERHEHKVIYDFFENHGYILFIPTWMYVKNDLWSTCRIPVNGVKNHISSLVR